MLNFSKKKQAKRKLSTLRIMIYQKQWIEEIIITGVCEGNDEASDSCEKTGGYLSFHSIQILLI